MAAEWNSHTARTAADRDNSKWSGGDARDQFGFALEKKSPVRRQPRSALEIEQNWPRAVLGCWLDLGLARGRLGHEWRLPACESARALMRKQAKRREEKGTYAAVSCSSTSASLVGSLAMSGGFLHTRACVLS